ncbi:hypothetical protein M427DRAFT_151941 [Gonapodya prolifera JEL478]|uniref:Prenylcysteine lyase domain-containing protein n=1 Tax=Gonapodya prolifera (strain JEL478) TaxID=1344416 RepID=A0A139AVD0_GONPJ|nr:hypothetical protein M427DRAFT_151941 [Gonapodya prolifera JEL478]|eukprot:KXS20667.1 hypothetical protein M427DRAFT_151941 [Gonapodya prolifera JEL478]
MIRRPIFVVLCAILISVVEAQRIAIVGTGPAGVSAAYFTRRYLPDAEIIAFERSKTLGGGGIPSPELEWGTIPRLMFGMVWSTVLDANLTADNFTTVEFRHGYWDAQNKTFDFEKVHGLKGWIPAVREFLKFGLAPPVQITRLEGDTYSRISRMSTNRRGFQTVSEILAFAMVDEEAGAYAAHALERMGILHQFQESRVNPALLKAVPSAEGMNGLSLVIWSALMRTTEFARRPNGGLSGLYNELLRAAKAQVQLDTTITSVSNSKLEGKIELEFADGSKEQFDSVILATGRSFEASTVLSAGGLPTLPEEELGTLHITYVEGELNAGPFGRNGPEDLPNPIYFLGASNLRAIERPNLVTHPNFHRITSAGPLSDLEISELFNATTKVTRHEVASPKFRPTDDYPPCQLAPRIVYASALSGVIPTTEGAFIGGKNAAMLLCQFVECKSKTNAKPLKKAPAAFAKIKQEL